MTSSAWGDTLSHQPNKIHPQHELSSEEGGGAAMGEEAATVGLGKGQRGGRRVVVVVEVAPFWKKRMS